jgi:hypothetical protein
LKKIIALVFYIALCTNANAQYYYKDILSTKQITLDLNTYKENKIRKISIKSFEDNGEESEGFFCEKKISKKYKTSNLFTRSNFSYASLFTATYDKAGKILTTYDSSELSVTEIRYTYNSSNQITNILSSIQSINEDFNNGIKEEHIYTYENNLVKSMQKIKNEKDTLTILFSADENGNITLEKDTKNGTKFYYYYDAKNRLTDIVPGTEYTKELKPDYIFEYNNAGLLTQMTAVEEGSSHYFIWKYSYDNGLRTKERCYSDERKLMGSIEYTYK